jgi:hypothetical protein
MIYEMESHEFMLYVLAMQVKKIGVYHVPLYWMTKIGLNNS